MGVEVLIPLLAVFSVLFIPIAGVTFVFTTRYALKPLVETLAKALKESQGARGTDTDLHLKIQDLTDSVEALSGELRALKEGHEFDRKLLESARPAPPDGVWGVDPPITPDS